MSKMTNLLNYTDPKKITFNELSGEILTVKKARSIVRFAIAYLKVFNDPFVSRALAVIYKLGSGPSKELTVILKRRNSIPFVEIHSPGIYVIKYWKLLTLLEFLSAEELKFKSFIKFHEDYGYLTKKQIRYATVIQHKHALDERNFLARLGSGEKKKILETIKSKLRFPTRISHEIPDAIKQEWKDFNPTFFQESPTNKKENVTIAPKDSSRESEVNPFNDFLSINEIREILSNAN